MLRADEVSKVALGILIHSVRSGAPSTLLVQSSAQVLGTISRVFIPHDTGEIQRGCGVFQIPLLESGKTSWAWDTACNLTFGAEAGGFQSSWLLLSLLFFFLIHY